MGTRHVLACIILSTLVAGCHHPPPCIDEAAYLHARDDVEVVLTGVMNRTWWWCDLAGDLASYGSLSCDDPKLDEMAQDETLMAAASRRLAAIVGDVDETAREHFARAADMFAGAARSIEDQHVDLTEAVSEWERSTAEFSAGRRAVTPDLFCHPA